MKYKRVSGSPETVSLNFITNTFYIEGEEQVFRKMIDVSAEVTEPKVLTLEGTIVSTEAVSDALVQIRCRVDKRDFNGTATDRETVEAWVIKASMEGKKSFFDFSKDAFELELSGVEFRKLKHSTYSGKDVFLTREVAK